MVPERCVLLPDVQFPVSQFSSVHVRKDQVVGWVLRVRRYVRANVGRCIRRVLLQLARARLASDQDFRLPALRVPVAVQAVLRAVPGSAMSRAA